MQSAGALECTSTGVLECTSGVLECDGGDNSTGDGAQLNSFGHVLANESAAPQVILDQMLHSSTFPYWCQDTQHIVIDCIKKVK